MGFSTVCSDAIENTLAFPFLSGIWLTGLGGSLLSRLIVLGILLSRLLGQAEKREAVLILRTVFGEKRIKLSDIQTALLDRGDGTVRDITVELLKED